MKTKLFVLLALFTTFNSANAVPLYSTLGAGNTYQSPHFVSHDENIVLPGTSDYVDVNWAMSWTSSMDAVVTDIDMALSLGDAFSSVDENIAQVYLHSDTGGLPGGIIDTYIFSGMVSEIVGGSVLSMASTLNPSVTAGETYWLSISAGFPGNGLYSQVGWHLNDQGASGGVARENDNGGWMISGVNSTQAAFRVSGTASIPEPTTVLLMVIGFAGLVLTTARGTRLRLIKNNTNALPA